jgi:hypothetical protein
MEAMKRKAIPIAVATVVLLLVIAYLWGPSSVPAGQDRFVTLSNANLSEFAAAFDDAAEELLAHYPDKRVRVLVIWEPILTTDWKAPSRSTLARISDRRAKQFGIRSILWPRRWLGSQGRNRSSQDRTAV